MVAATLELALRKAMESITMEQLGCVQCGREDSETINGCDLCLECSATRDAKVDETLWASIGYRLGQLLGEAVSAGVLTEATAAPALLGLKAGLRDYGTLGATRLLEQIQEWTVEDIIGIRDGIQPNIEKPRR